MTDELTQKRAQPALDLDAYLARIGYEAVSIRLSKLSGLALRACFRDPVRESRHRAREDDLASTWATSRAKLVTARRGGYCFEQNALFAAVLESLGFEVIAAGGAGSLLARRDPAANCICCSR